ncbi:MAG: hypothetical protein ACJ8FY_11125 [Gemmataceae bacterium]
MRRPISSCVIPLASAARRILSRTIATDLELIPETTIFQVYTTVVI